MNDDRSVQQQALSDLANALQVAAPLAASQRRILGTLADDAATLDTALERAARARHRLVPTDGETGGAR